MTTIDHMIDQFLDHRRLRGVRPGSIDLYQRILLAWRDWRHAEGLSAQMRRITIDELRRYLRYLAEEHVPHGTNPHRPADPTRGLSPATRDTVWRTLRAFWRFAAGEGMLTVAQQQFFANGRLPRPQVPDQIRPTYDEHTIRCWLAACDERAQGHSEEAGLRDQTILLLLLESGMRAIEVCRLQDDDVDQADRCARVLGKGSVVRWVFWSPRTAAALRVYLHKRRGPYGGPVFRGVQSKNMGGALTPDAVRSLIRRVSKRSGVPFAPSAPVHALRHTFAHHALDYVDGLYLQQLLGHRSSKTTERYVRNHPERLRRVYGRIRWDDEPAEDG